MRKGEREAEEEEEDEEEEKWMDDAGLTTAGRRRWKAWMKEEKKNENDNEEKGMRWKGLEERKGKSGGVGDEGVSDERAVPVAREAFERPMHVDPPENPPASPAVKRRTDHKAMWVEAERFWKIGRVDQQKERILQASEADADAERRAFLKAFEADDQERRRDEALESALRAYEPTSPTSASVSVHDIQ